MKRQLLRLKLWALRTYWTQQRTNAWLTDHVPHGYVVAGYVVDQARRVGIPRDRFVKARDVLDPIIWDGDGHHLTLWMRRGSPSIERLHDYTKLKRAA